jgi:hypothetical protein
MATSVSLTTSFSTVLFSGGPLLSLLITTYIFPQEYYVNVELPFLATLIGKSLSHYKKVRMLGLLRPRKVFLQRLLIKAW